MALGGWSGPSPARTRVPAARLREDVDALLVRQATGEEDLELAAAVGCSGLFPELRVDGLRRHDDRALGMLAVDVGADVGAVGDDRVGVAVDVAQRQVGQRVRGGARVAPDRRPEHEGDACCACARVGGRERRPARDPGDHGAVAAGRGDPGDRPLRRGDHGEGQFLGSSAAAVAKIAADQREDDVLVRSWSAANAPIRNGGAWFVTNRTGFTAARPRKRRPWPCRTAPR